MIQHGRPRWHEIGFEALEGDPPESLLGRHPVVDDGQQVDVEVSYYEVPYRNGRRGDRQEIPWEAKPDPPNPYRKSEIDDYFTVFSNGDRVNKHTFEPTDSMLSSMTVVSGGGTDSVAVYEAHYGNGEDHEGWAAAQHTEYHAENNERVVTIRPPDDGDGGAD